VRLTTWIWLAPVVFLLHDAEELATIAPWLRAHAAQLPAILQLHTATVTTRGMATSVAVLLVALVLAAWHGARRARVGRRSWPFLVAAGALAGNALTHVGQAVYFRGYTPGLVTALILCAPYALLLARALGRAELLTRRAAVALLLVGVVIQAPIAVAALAAGGNLAAAAP
jgi:hypothetical protein